MSNLRLPFEQVVAVESRIDARDRAGRARAVDPRFNVALEASAGTGKTRVLVDRYINLLKAGVDPANILAITFTRKAAAEMRERILSTLRAAAANGDIPATRWRDLRDRTADIDISTIDAFCLSLLREFPLEADLDPGFTMADDTEVPRLIDEALDRALRICRGIAREDEHVALVFAQLGDRRARAGLAALLNRRIVAPGVLARYLASGPRELSVAGATRAGAAALLDVFAGMPGGADAFVESGPPEPAFLLVVRSLRKLESALQDSAPLDPAAVQVAFARIRDHFMTQEGQPRKRVGYKKELFTSLADWRTHGSLVVGHAAAFAAASARYRRDLNVLVSRGVWRMYKVAETEYRRTLETHAVLDFSDVLLRALDLLRQMEEFAQSRYRLEARYHHVLVDEFQDTSRAQWELVSLLVESWGEGAGLHHVGPVQPSIFIVGDRKQSIYGFRDADASVLQEAARHLESLRPDGNVRWSISRSFRSAPALLSLINDLCQDIDKAPSRRDAFQYDEQDRFPIDDLALVATTEDETPGPPRTSGGTRPTDAAALDAAVGRVRRSEGDADPASAADVGRVRHSEEHADPAPGRPVALPPPVASPLGLVVADSAEECAEITAAEIERLVAAGAPVRDRNTGVRRPVRPGDVAILFRTRESHREFEDALERRGLPSYVYKGLGFFDADEIKDTVALLWFLADPLSDLRAAAWLRSRFIRMSDEGLRRLAPRLAEAITADHVPAALDPADAAALGRARAGAARWLRLVDRMPPAELLDVILNESAYALEMRGSRCHQARENLKKIRGLVRRIQNRGYATLWRVVAHLDRLAVGDEANATIDALDAVNLMTIHASKGLEFPVVFIVNLARGTGNRRDAIRVAADEAGGDGASVSVGDFQSESDDDDAAKDREETKRLLYVALTRARDRLYLGTALKDGAVQAGRGSLAEVLPPSFLEPFRQAAAGSESVQWRAASGTVHIAGVCAPARTGTTGTSMSDTADTADTAGTTATTGAPLNEPAAAMPSATHFSHLRDASPVRRSAAVTAAGLSTARAPLPGGRSSDRLAGILVHRLLQRVGLAGASLDCAQLRDQASRLLRPDEGGDLENHDELIEEVVTAYVALCTRDEVLELYRGGTILHEVPFTMASEDGVVRGTIDCLVQASDGGVTVLEFKTGRRRPEHEQQAALYKRAAEQVFPGVWVQARLVYLA